MIRLVPLSVALILLAGCAGSAFKAVPVDPKTGYFPTDYILQADGLTVSKKVPLEKYTQLLYVMVVDAGRKKITPRTTWDVISTNPAETKPIAGYERSAPSIQLLRFAGPGASGERKQEIDKFFLKSFQEIGFFDRVLVIPQDDFEKIIRSGEDKRRAPDKERLRQSQLELAALKISYKDGAIDDGEYMRRQREIVDEQHKTVVALNKSTAFFTSLTGLRDVQEYYGDHMVVGIIARGDAFRDQEVDLRVLDPVTGDVIFRAYNSALSSGKSRLPLDQRVFYPLFNAFIDWVDKNSGILR